MRSIDSGFRFAVALALWTAVGCSSSVPLRTEDGGIGDPCVVHDECRPGLICRPGVGTCGPAGHTAEGGQCSFTDDCVAEDDLACLYEVAEDGRPRTVCRPAGSGAAGEFCVSTADCARGLVCAPAGFGGACAESGRGDLGDTCAATSDCFAGLVCGPTGRCERAATSTVGAGFPIWTGVECTDDAGPARFFFEVPRGGALAAGQDFFRLPFPNDVRRDADGHPRLFGFPHPEMAGVPFDLLDRYLRAVETDLDGFGTYGTVYFRSSKSLDFGTLVGGGDRPTIWWVDLTPPAEPGGDYGRVGYAWSASTGMTRYLCANWLAVRPPRGAPLRPGRTYAVVLAAGIRSSASEAFSRDDDFAAMLRSTPPSGDADLEAAWQAYRPFRDYLTAEGIDPGTLLAAAVFTTQSVPGLLDATRGVVDELPAPALVDAVLCGPGVVSPCDDGLTGEQHVRGCFESPADPAFREVQGVFEVPVFQEGIRPYLRPSDGGGFRLDGDGRPLVQTTERVCFSLAVPTSGPMPDDGWPAVLYTHGTGGDYRSFIRSGVADQLSTAYIAGSEARGFAVLSFDQPMHGPRRGLSTESPEMLFFNVVNPAAARGNVLQGAVDGWQAVRLLLATDLDETASPTGAALRFDPARLYYYGHSQGATHGALTLPWEPALSAAVLSGAGAGLIDSLVDKTSPYDVRGALRMALFDPDVNDLHPALTVFQTWLEAADPINYGRRIISDPDEAVGPHHVLMTYGVGDSYSPRSTLIGMASVLGLATAGPAIDDVGGFAALEPPVSANRNIRGTLVTAVLSQHDPGGGYDGHFVSTRDGTAMTRITRFFATAAGDGIPTVP